jgi:hypothetical protein
MLALPFLPMDGGNVGKTDLFGKLEIENFGHGHGSIGPHSTKQICEKIKGGIMR